MYHCELECDTIWRSENSKSVRENLDNLIYVLIVDTFHYKRIRRKKVNFYQHSKFINLYLVIISNCAGLAENSSLSLLLSFLLYYLIYNGIFEFFPVESTILMLFGNFFCQICSQLAGKGTKA